MLLQFCLNYHLIQLSRTFVDKIFSCIFLSHFPSIFLNIHFLITHEFDSIAWITLLQANFKKRMQKISNTITSVYYSYLLLIPTKLPIIKIVVLMCKRIQKYIHYHWIFVLDYILRTYSNPKGNVWWLV